MHVGGDNLKILDAKVHFWEDPHVMNDPELIVLVDEIPDRSTLIYHVKKDIFYFAEKDGYVNFFTWSGEGNDGGYYDMEFPVQVEVGGRIKKITAAGPWSSRSGVMNTAGFTPSMEVGLATTRKDFDRGYTLTAGAITVSKAKEALNMTSYRGMVKLVKQTDDTGEIRYAIMKVPPGVITLEIA